MSESFFIIKIPITAILLAMLVTSGASAQELWITSDDQSPDDLCDLSLEELLDVSIKADDPGWFGTQLEQLDVDPYLHGYAAVMYRDYDLNRGRDVDTFDLHYFNVVVGAQIGEKIAAEVLLEYEHGGDDMGVRYGLIDYKLAESATLRMGKFLVPMGKFNEYLSPEYANKLPDRPYCLWRIVPVVWAETGVQLRGIYDLDKDQTLNYALYVVNGLEQEANPNGSVGEGGDIRGMRGNNRDSNSSAKAYGGRIGYKPRRDFEVGASLYTGAYSIDRKQNLSIMDLDMEYRTSELTLRGEYVRSSGCQHGGPDEIRVLHGGRLPV